MKKIIVAFAVIVLSIGVNLYAQDRGIGLRVGAPMGITYKKYVRKSHAIELGLGTISQGWYDQYYENSFGQFKKYNNKQYLSHHVENAVVFQARYLVRYGIPIEGMMGDLEWYWGGGGFLKFGNVQYRYRDEFNDIRTSAHTDVDLGPEGIIGMEYTFEDVPLTIFGEFSLMVEIADRPGAFRGFSGVGVRYNF